MRWIFPTMPITSTSVPKPLATMITAMTMKPIWKLRVASDVSRSPKPTLVEVIGIVGKIHRIEKFCSRGVTADLISEIDEDGSGDVDRFEFLTYMLVNMGKIEIEDVEQVMELFKHYDIDNSGYLTIDDVVQANKIDGPDDGKPPISAA